jgi:hypothetical protein
MTAAAWATAVPATIALLAWLLRRHYRRCPACQAAFRKGAS